jgi:hypothetical protein
MAALSVRFQKIHFAHRRSIPRGECDEMHSGLTVCTRTKLAATAVWQEPNPQSNQPALHQGRRRSSGEYFPPLSTEGEPLVEHVSHGAATVLLKSNYRNPNDA